ncbi:hypothetical protein ES703_00807 [subsurface metagenome]
MEEEEKRASREARIRIDHRRLAWVIKGLKLELLANKGREDPDRYDKMSLLSRLARYVRHGIVGRASDLSYSWARSYSPKSSKDRKKLEEWAKIF